MGGGGGIFCDIQNLRSHAKIYKNRIFGDTNIHLHTHTQKYGNIFYKPLFLGSGDLKMDISTVDSKSKFFQDHNSLLSPTFGTSENVKPQQDNIDESL